MTPSLEDVVQPDHVVGGYRIEKKLGAGGFGHVYLARRDGVACALKFIHPGRVGDWGWRELYIMQRHEFSHVVRLLGHFKWPEDKPEYLVLVMEYVPGPTLYQWARENNPSARQVVEKLLMLSRALQEVHAKEVLHRDLKGDNILVRETNGEPVLVDFGAGTMRDVPRATRNALAPANARYRSPESVAFFLRTDRAPGERYPYAVTDETYALGVLLYVLLTEQYPFGGPEDELLVEIMTSAPRAPRERNSRVPPALDGLCLRLLAKDPHARVPNAEALCAQLVKLLDEAKGDARWDLPLCYGWTLEGRTTEAAPEVVGKQAKVWMKRWLRKKPRRGPRPPLPDVAPAPFALPSTHLDRPRRPSSPWTLALSAVLLCFAVLVGLSGVRGLDRELTRVQALLEGPRSQAPTGPLDEDFLSKDPWSWTMSVHEVAPPWKPREAGSGAVPSRADTPAPVTPVTLRTEATRMKKPSAPPRQKQARGCPGPGLLLSMAAAANLACPAAPVRPSPPPSRACPAGAVETMTGQLGLPIGNHDGDADLPNHVPGSGIVPVQEGPLTLTLVGDWDVKGHMVLPHGTQLSGQLYLGDKRAYGLITQAVTPTRDTFNVCMELRDGFDHARGVAIESWDGQTPMLHYAVTVQAVDHFE